MTGRVQLLALEVEGTLISNAVSQFPRPGLHASANEFDHIRRVNALLGLFVPALVTPLELSGEDDDGRG